MHKSKKHFLTAIAVIAVLIVAVIFATPKSAWEDARLMIALMFQKYNTTPTKPSYYRGDMFTTTAPIPNEGKDVEPATNAAPEKSHGVFIGPSLYRNSEFGFEFSIPDGWQAEENLFWSPYSNFNLTLEPLNKQAYYPDPVGINIVKHGFVEMSYSGSKPDDKPIAVDGVNGVKYEYAYEGAITSIIFFHAPKTTS